MAKFDGSESSRGERKRQEKESETESASEAEMVKYDGSEGSRKGKRKRQERESETESEKRRMKKKMKKREKEKRRKKEEKVSGSGTESKNRRKVKKMRKREKEKWRKKQEKESVSETESDKRHRGKRTEKVGRVEPEPVPEGYFVPSDLSTEMKDDLERRGTTCVFIQTSRRVSSRDVHRFFEPKLKVKQVQLVYSESGRYTGVGFVEFDKLVHVLSALDYSGNLLHHYPVLVRYVEVDDYLDKGPMPEVLDNPPVLVGPHEVSPEAERYRNMSGVVEDSRHPKLEPTQCMVLENMFDKTLADVNFMGQYVIKESRTHGELRHLFIHYKEERLYLVFENVEVAVAARDFWHMSLYGGRTIYAYYVPLLQFKEMLRYHQANDEGNFEGLRTRLTRRIRR